MNLTPAPTISPLQIHKSLLNPGDLKQQAISYSLLTNFVKTYGAEIIFGRNIAIVYYAVFDPQKITIIGREINGQFELMPESATSR